jgi:mRNA interferase MazF
LTHSKIGNIVCLSTAVRRYLLPAREENIFLKGGMYQKRFDEWNVMKQSIENIHDHTPHLRVGEVRWTSLGVNIGSEIDGKGNSFLRPCLILHVIGGKRAIVLPLTSKIKTEEGYLSFELHGRISTLCINQLRSISQNRIYNRLGRISDERLMAIKSEVGIYLRIL